jgi:hypothetical protein
MLDVCSPSMAGFIELRQTDGNRLGYMAKNLAEGGYYVVTPDFDAALRITFGVAPGGGMVDLSNVSCLSRSLTSLCYAIWTSDEPAC